MHHDASCENVHNSRGRTDSCTGTCSHNTVCGVRLRTFIHACSMVEKTSMTSERRRVGIVVVETHHYSRCGSLMVWLSFVLPASV